MQVDGPGTAYLFFYDKQGHHGLGQDTAYAIWAHVSLPPLVEAWWWAVATSDRQMLRGWAENPASRIPVVTAGEFDFGAASGEYTPASWEMDHSRRDG